MMLRSLRYVIRELTVRPGVTVVAVATLALGIAVNTVIFSGVYSLLWRPLPYPHADRLVALSRMESSGSESGIDYRDFDRWRQSNPTFEEMAASRWLDVNMSNPGPDSASTERIVGSLVSENLVSLLGSHAVLGRTFVGGDFAAGREHVVLLSHELWGRVCGADPEVIGRELLLDGQPHVVVGVMPEDFRYPRRSRLWKPLSLAEHAKGLGSDPFDVDIVARLRPGADADDARAEMAPLLARALEARGESAGLVAPVVRPLRKAMMAARLRRASVVMQVAVACVLLIACANVSSLLMARQEERRREFVVRLALGAGRMRIARQLLAESLVLSLMGCVLGILGARWGLTVLKAVVPWPAVGTGEASIDVSVLFVTIGVSMLTGVLVGLMPAARAAGQDPNLGLTSGTPGSATASGAGQLGGQMAAIQMALATALLVSAGLAVRAFLGLAVQDPGFETKGAIALTVNAPASMSEEFAVGEYLPSLIETVARLPGVEVAGAVGYTPLVGYNPGVTFLVEGPVPADPARAPRVDFQPVTPDYFDAMRIPVLRGRRFDRAEMDTPGSQRRVALVNLTLAQRFWPERNAMGQTIWLPEHAGEQPFTVVGIVGDVKQFGLDTDTRPEVYVPSYRWTSSTIIARTDGRTTAVLEALRAELARRQGDGVAFQLRTLDQLVSSYLLFRRTFVTFMAAFAVMALGLAALGVYGTCAYGVARRSREFGIRMAVGARRSDVVRLVLTQSLRAGAFGVALGVALSYLFTGALRGIIYGINSTGPGVVLVLALCVWAVSVTASIAPALRAAKTNPAAILRGD